jgi:ribosomal RNA-processing protein 12
MSLEEKLAKVKSPNLQNQQHVSRRRASSVHWQPKLTSKQTHLVLSSVEETLKDQNTNFTPTAYFAALLALLRQSSSAPATENNAELVTSTVYLLDLVSSHVPTPLLRTQLSQILSLLSPIFTNSEATAPLLRSTIGCLESLLVAQDSAAWNLPANQIGPRKAIPILMNLALDGRPKVRKRSLEALTAVLKHPPHGPALDHPVADLCASTSLTSLKEAFSSSSRLKKQKARDDDGHDPYLMHVLQLAKSIAAASGGWPSKKIEPLVEALITISKSTNDYLVMSAFEVFEAIFEGMQDEISSSKLPRLLDAVAKLKPSHNDSQLVPPWVAVLSRGYQLASEFTPADTFVKLPDLVDMIMPFLSSPNHNIRVSASECLISLFTNCIPRQTIIEPSVYDEKIFEQLARRGNDMLSIRYQTAWMEVFKILSALIQAMRWRGSQHLLPIIKAVGELRGNDSFQGKKEADGLLGHAIRNMGPDVILSVLPHNLDRNNNKHPGRAWLLPLLRDHASNTTLAHFKSELMPLSEQIYQHVIEHDSAEKTPRIKIYETIVHQIWATLPGYCDLPIDLRVTVDQSFAELISNLLYKQTDLRVDLCRSLQNLVESNQAVLGSGSFKEDMLYERRITQPEAAKNIEHLAGLSSNILAVLFNVYSQTPSQSRAYILECINAYLSITTEQDLVDTFNRISSLLEISLPKFDEPPPPKQPQSKDKIPPASHSLLDLVIALSIYLPRSSFPSLFSLASRILTHPAATATDPQLIKKAYKLIPRLATSSTGVLALQARNSDLQSLILSTINKTPVPARRDRLLAIHTLISFLPTPDLHFIPSILSEVVLACKDTNQRAREAGFDLLIHVTNRINDKGRNPPGTVIKNCLVSHMPDDAPDAPASLEEVFTMVSAGLAGVAPHMVAATVAALARLLFEFHDELARPVLEDLVGTVEMFLQSNNREIVRAVLGFVKVAVVVLPEDLLGEQRMIGLMKGCMVWSKENKGRMRMKVKGILERCIRRFGAEKVEGWMDGDDGGRKLVGNIRKRRERAKKKKTGKAEYSSDEEDAGQGGKARKTEFDNEFDEAVYGSDDDSDIIIGSDDGDEDPDEEMTGISFKKGPRATDSSSSRRKGQKDQFIRASAPGDDPLDLLSPNALANISSKKAVRFSSNDQLSRRKTKARTNEDGKLVFGHDSDDDHGDVLMGGAGDVSAGKGGDNGGAVNAYIDAVDGPDAVRRGQKGKLKVSSGNQEKDKRNFTAEGRDREGGGGEVELGVEEAREVARNIMRAGLSPRAGKFPQRRGLGVEKQKVARGGGDNWAGGRAGGARDGKLQKQGSSGRGRGGGGGRGRGRGGGSARGSGRGKVRFGGGRGIRR